LGGSKGDKGEAASGSEPLSTALSTTEELEEAYTKAKDRQ
jgi:hypothetical protein